MPEDSRKSIEGLHKADPEDPLGSTELTLQKIPAGVDRRAFFMRSAMIGATAVMTGCSVSAEKRAEKSAGAAPPPQLSPDLNVVKAQKGPVMTTLDEFYKVGPGPSS